MDYVVMLKLRADQCPEDSAKNILDAGAEILLNREVHTPQRVILGVLGVLAASCKFATLGSSS